MSQNVPSLPAGEERPGDPISGGLAVVVALEQDGNLVVAHHSEGRGGFRAARGHLLIRPNSSTWRSRAHSARA